MKNQSGNNDKTVGLNGHGIKLTIDRLLPEDENSFACAYSINDKMKCTIGHFTYTNWIRLPKRKSKKTYRNQSFRRF